FVDIAEEASRALVGRLEGAGPKPLFRKLDLTDIPALHGVFGEVEQALGGIDILVNNAGNDDRHTLSQVTPEYWDDRMSVNLKHMFFAAKAVVPAMERAGGGVILNFG